MQNSDNLGFCPKCSPKKQSDNQGIILVQFKTSTLCLTWAKILAVWTSSPLSFCLCQREKVSKFHLDRESWSNLFEPRVTRSKRAKRPLEYNITINLEVAVTTSCRTSFWTWKKPKTIKNAFDGRGSKNVIQKFENNPRTKLRSHLVNRKSVSTSDYNWYFSR